VLILIGSILASLQGFVAQELVPKGEIFHVQNLVNNGFFSVTTQQISSRINDFWIKYDSTNKISQFYSDLSLLNQSGHEIKRKIIYVNETLSYKNIVFYQTDWDILGLQAKINNSSTIQLPLAATTNNRSDNNLWRSFFLTDLKTNNGFSIIINDLTGRFSIYNIDGQMLQKSYLGSSNTVEGINFTISDIFIPFVSVESIWNI
jgi:cytochrome c biogenesis protein